VARIAGRCDFTTELVKKLKDAGWQRFGLKVGVGALQLKSDARPCMVWEGRAWSLGIVVHAVVPPSRISDAEALL